MGLGCINVFCISDNKLFFKNISDMVKNLNCKVKLNKVEDFNNLKDKDVDLLVINTDEIQVLKALNENLKGKIFLLTNLKEKLVLELGITNYIIKSKQANDGFSIIVANMISLIAKERALKILTSENVEIISIIKQLPFPFILKDLEGNILKTNNKQFYNKQIDINSIINTNGKKFINNEDFIRSINEDKYVLKTKKVCTFINDYSDEHNKYVVEVHKVPLKNSQNEIKMILDIYIDVTNDVGKLEEIRKLSELDSLTMLRNRSMFLQHLEDLKESKKEWISMLSIDLDNFKVINDSLGYSRGNDILITFANMLKVCFKEDFIARVAGDEFVVVLNGVVERAEVIKKIELLYEKINSDINNKNIISISMGALIDNIQTNSIDRLLKKCSLALIESKKIKRNSYIFYSDELDYKFNLMVNIEKDLPMAIQNKEVEIYYQPQYTIDKKVIGLEALTRWNTEKYKDVPVIDIINFIEKSSYFEVFNDYVMKEAFLFSKEINENRDDKLVVSINVSAIQIISNDFLNKLINLIEEYDIPKDGIGIEITESTFLKSSDENLKKLKTIDDLGIYISLDDFGTGYSSLSYLLDMPVSTIKIDRSFITDIFKHDRKKNIVALITDASHRMNMSVLAEGVEFEEELNILRELGVEYIQGYFFSKPLNIDDAKEIIQ